MADQVSAVTGSQKVGTAMALSLKQAHFNSRDDGLTLNEREAQAETRFKAIKDKIIARQGGDRYATNVDYVSTNMLEAEQEAKPDSKLLKLENHMQVQKLRYLIAKSKRDKKEKAREKFRVLQLNKWDLIKKIRLNERDKLEDKIYDMKWARSWHHNIAIYATIVKAFKNFATYRDNKI